MARDRARHLPVVRGQREVEVKRTRTKPPAAPILAILTADWHLREDRPICRTDDYWGAQDRKLRFVRDLQAQYSVPVIHAGDLFDHWKPSPFLLSFAIHNLPERFYTIAGNHDLPQHNIEQVGKSGIATLEAAGAITVLSGVHWGQEPSEEHVTRWGPDGLRLLVWHVMTWHGERPYPSCTDPPARKLLKRHSYADLILTGHNHIPFLVEHNGRKMLNPGSLMRIKADQQDHVPSVYLWYEDNSLEQVVLRYEKGVVTREHIEAKAADDPRRYKAFIEQLRENAPEISFRKNIEQFLAKSHTSKRVKELVWESLGEP